MGGLSQECLEMGLPASHGIQRFEARQGDPLVPNHRRPSFRSADPRSAANRRTVASASDLGYAELKGLALESAFLSCLPSPGSQQSNTPSHSGPHNADSIPAA